MKNINKIPARPQDIHERFFELSNDLFCITGLDGTVKLLNPAFETILGYSREEYLNRPFTDLIHPDDRDANLAELQDLMEGKPVVYCEHRYLCKDGSYRWLAWTAHAERTENLIYAVGRDITGQRLAEEEISSLKRHFLEDELAHREAFSSIITKSKKMRAIFHYIEAVAHYEKPVFITGETGVGKELIAQSIHRVSGVKGPFVAVNVAGLDDTMFSDALFGHKKGAFTGADREREGLIVQASGGTLLLDEIGDLHETSQVKLLRLLEEQTYYPLGSDAAGRSNARIIATSNHDIQQQIADGRFRKDLYYRLCFHHIHVPPLRERLEDIPLLLDCFLEGAAESQRKKKPTPPSELVTLMANYHFAGNVREMKAMVFDAVAQHKSGILSLDNFKAFIRQKGTLSQKNAARPARETISMIDIFGHFPTMKEAETYLISEALKRADENQGIAASLLGIHRQALNRRLKKKS